MSPALAARVARLIQEQKEVTELLRQALCEKEALAAAMEIRLGRPPLDGIDVITAEDIQMAAAMAKVVDTRGEPVV